MTVFALDLGSSALHVAHVRPQPPLHGPTVPVIAAAPWSEDRVIDASVVIELAALYRAPFGDERTAAILAFAREHGAIGYLQEFRVEGAREGVLAERLDHWNEVIDHFAWLCGCLVELGMIQREDETETEALLAGLVTTPHLLRLREQAPLPALTPDIKIGPKGLAYLTEWVERCVAGGYTPTPEATTRRVQQALQKDEEFTLPKLTPAEARAAQLTELRRTLQQELQRVGPERQPEIQPVMIGDDLPLRCEWRPATLRAALTLQIVALVEQAGAASEPVGYRTCLVCPRVIVHSRDRRTGRRVDSEICSPACAMRQLRQRKAKARQLEALGRTVEEIITELHIREHKGRSAKAIVSGWLSKARS